jgi:hypothetical protein
VIEAAVIGAPDEHGLIKPQAYCVLRDTSAVQASSTPNASIRRPK